MSMKPGKRIYGKKHQRRAAGREGRKSDRTWLRANVWKLFNRSEKNGDE